jgi:hypothetical protein
LLLWVSLRPRTLFHHVPSSLSGELKVHRHAHFEQNFPYTALLIYKHLHGRLLFRLSRNSHIFPEFTEDLHEGTFKAHKSGVISGDLKETDDSASWASTEVVLGSH